VCERGWTWRWLEHGIVGVGNERECCGDELRYIVVVFLTLSDGEGLHPLRNQPAAVSGGVVESVGSEEVG